MAGNYRTIGESDGWLKTENDFWRKERGVALSTIAVPAILWIKSINIAVAAYASDCGA